MKKVKKVKSYEIYITNNFSKLHLLKKIHSALNAIKNNKTLSDKKFGEWLDAYLD